MTTILAPAIKAQRQQQALDNATRISPRMHRPERRFGGSLGITIWTYSRRIGHRSVEFDITHDGATGETTVRVYPGGGLVPPSHDFMVRGLSKREIGRLIYQIDTPAA